MIIISAILGAICILGLLWLAGGDVEHDYVQVPKRYRTPSRLEEWWYTIKEKL